MIIERDCRSAVILTLRESAEDEHRADQERRADGETDPRHIGKADDQIADRADDRRQSRIGDLGFDMADMLTLRAGGGEDRGVGDWGAVVAVDGAREGCAEGGNQEIAAAGRGADHGHDGDQQSEGSP